MTEKAARLRECVGAGSHGFPLLYVSVHTETLVIDREDAGKD